MTFAQAVRTCFAKYATFSGRASRPEYWWFFLFLLLGSIVAGFLDGLIFGTAEVAVSAGDGDVAASASNNGPIGSIFALATFIPALAAGWRRMHDSGRSGLYLLYPLIVIVGIGGYVSVFGAVAFGSGGYPTAFAGPFGIVLVLAILVLAISPLLVLWWLTRPTEPKSNQWGPPPTGSRANRLEPSR